MKTIEVTEEEEALILKMRADESKQDKFKQTGEVDTLMTNLELNMSDLKSRIDKANVIEPTKLDEAITNAESIVNKLKSFRKEV